MAFLDETGLAYFWQQIVAKIPVSLKNPYALTVNVDGTSPDFKNGETWGMSIKDGVVITQKVGDGT